MANARHFLTRRSALAGMLVFATMPAEAAIRGVSRVQVSTRSRYIDLKRMGPVLRDELIRQLGPRDPRGPSISVELLRMDLPVGDGGLFGSIDHDDTLDGRVTVSSGRRVVHSFVVNATTASVDASPMNGSATLFRLGHLARAFAYQAMSQL